MNTKTILTVSMLLKQISVVLKSESSSGALRLSPIEIAPTITFDSDGPIGLPDGPSLSHDVTVMATAARRQDSRTHKTTINTTRTTFLRRSMMISYTRLALVVSLSTRTHSRSSSIPMTRGTTVV